MMKQLIKMEFKSSNQKIGVVLLGSVIIGVLVFLSGNNSLGEVPGRFLLPILWMIALFAVVILFINNIVTSFTKRVYSKEGYLALTLPVTSFQLVVSKLIVQLIWLVLIIAAMVMMVFLIGVSAGVNLGDLMSGIFEVIGNIFTDFTSLLIFLDSLVGVIFNIAVIWFFISLTNTKITRSKRTLIAVIAYVAFGIILSNILNMVYEGIFGSRLVYMIGNSVLYGNSSALQNYYLLNLLIHAGLFFLFLYGTIYLLDNHIELE